MAPAGDAAGGPEKAVGSEHLLLGLLREGEGLAARVLRKLGADLENTRAAVRAQQASQA